MKTTFEKITLICLAVLMMAAASGAQTKPKRSAPPQRVRIEIGERGFAPASVDLRRGVPAEITFVRTTDATCAKEIVIADYKITKALPLNKPVTVTLTPANSGTVGFACGMGMMRGKLIVR